MDRLKALAAQDLSAKDIAIALARESRLRVSKNTVVGKLHRLKLWPTAASLARQAGSAERIASAAARGGRRVRKPARASRMRATEREGVSTMVPAKLAVKPPAEPVGPSQSRPCSVLELNGRRCRWPIGDPRKPGFHFCGAAKPDDGEPYCKTHTRMALAPPRPAKQSCSSNGEKHHGTGCRA
jgi:GcrA cell cycle regulator